MLLSSAEKSASPTKKIILVEQFMLTIATIELTPEDRGTFCLTYYLNLKPG